MENVGFDIIAEWLFDDITHANFRLVMADRIFWIPSIDGGVEVQVF